MRNSPVRHPTAIPVQFLALLGFWFLLSGRTDPLFVAMGVFSAALATAVTLDLTTGGMRGLSLPLRSLPRRLWHAGIYIAWLLARMTVASVQVAYVVLQRKMPLDPASVRLRTGLRSPIARTIAANTITLIPGTMTVDVDDNEITVHMFTPAAAANVISGELFNKVGAIFLERPGPPEVLDPPEREGTT
jgi:multicomponent Na+:H+ antiporter subunit E